MRVPLVRFTVRRMLVAVAGVAVLMAVLRHPIRLQFPSFVFALTILYLIIVQRLILERRLGAFHYTFLAVGLVASLTIDTFCSGSLGILLTSIGLYRGIPGTPNWTRQSLAYLAIADRCVTSTLVLILSWAAGLLMALARRRQPRPGRLDRPITLGRHIKSFYRGAFIGFVAYTVILTFSYLSRTPSPLPYYAEYVPLLGVGLALCLFFGGAVALLLYPPPRRERLG